MGFFIAGIVWGAVSIWLLTKISNPIFLILLCIVHFDVDMFVGVVICALQDEYNEANRGE